MTINEFLRDAIGLPDDKFEEAMRLKNNDKEINNINLVAWTKDAIEAYGRY